MTPAQKRIKRWREDPVTFATEVLKVEPDPWQVDVLRAFPKNRRVAMKACKGPGKTALLAMLAWNFLATRTHPKVAATSISGDNLADGLWTEMSKWQGRSEFLQNAFQWTKTRIFAKDHPETWWMSARSWAKGSDKAQQANTLAGLHADNMMFILDEVGGIPDAVMAAAEAGLANDHGDDPNHDAKIIMAGNPTHNEGPLYRACTSERHLWWVIEITSDPDDPKRTPRVSISWAREQIQKYGRDNPWVLVNVFGRFPPSSINSLLGPDEVSAAMSRHLSQDSFIHIQKRLGIDVARYGDDSTVIFPRQGLAAFEPIQMRNAKTHEIAARVATKKTDFGSEIEFMDDTGGWAAGVIDTLIQMGHSPHPVNFSGKAIDPRFFNKRAEMWFEMASWVKRGGVLPNIPELAKELTAPEYTIKDGKFLIEPKDQIKEKLSGQSPDLADALALTFALKDMPAALTLPGMDSPMSRYIADYDPFDPDRM